MPDLAVRHDVNITRKYFGQFARFFIADDRLFAITRILIPSVEIQLVVFQVKETFPFADLDRPLLGPDEIQCPVISLARQRQRVLKHAKIEAVLYRRKRDLIKFLKIFFLTIKAVDTDAFFCKIHGDKRDLVFVKDRLTDGHI